MYVNSSIESYSPDKGGKSVGKNVTVSEDQEPQRPLFKEEERHLLVKAFADLLDVVNLLFMSEWGCIHLGCEWPMSTGENTRPRDAFVGKYGRCKLHCYICRKDHRRYMLLLGSGLINATSRQIIVFQIKILSELIRII